jgi:hypothetical protein
MFGPGEYRPDPSEGITAPADLPQPEIVPYSRNDIRQPCPRCSHSAYRDKQSHRTLHDLGNLDVWCPRDLIITYSQHYCTKCRKYFSADLGCRTSLSCISKGFGGFYSRRLRLRTGKFSSAF